MKDAADVVVIGGGPAGATAAATLARAGVDALVLERDEFPRFHIGESLLPHSLKVLARLGVLEKIDARYIRKLGARFVDAATERTQTYLFADAFDRSVAHAYQVPRADFDALLLDHAASLGARVRNGWEVSSIRFEGGVACGVVARTHSGEEVEIRARVVVDASGRDTVLASPKAKRAAGEAARAPRDKRRLPGLDKTALFAHYRGALRETGPNEGNIDIVVFPHGWFWNIPFRGDVSSVGVVLSSAFVRSRREGEPLEALFARAATEAPFVQRLLAASERLTPVRALADFSYRVDTLAGDGWVRAGDAGGFIDPLFSTGVHLAFHSGELAGETIAAALAGDGDVSAARWAGYERAVRRGAELFVGAVQAFYGGELAALIFEEPQRKVLRQTITSLLAGDVFDDQALWARFLRDRYPARFAEG